MQRSKDFWWVLQLENRSGRPQPEEQEEGLKDELSIGRYA